jgi:uncharacterized membrane protein
MMDDSQPSSTGLRPATAGALAYVAGPFSGALFLVVERTSRSVRFHAWQALLGLGTLGALAVVCLGLAFLMLIVSPTIFKVLLWASALAAISTLLVGVACVVQAFAGRRYRIPIAGGFAERLAGR